MTPIEQLAQQAMSLPSDDRAYLADLLERSLLPRKSISPEIHEAWSKEIDRRIAAYDRGETQEINYNDAIQNMRNALAAHRANKAAS
jgi:hypothetical protein